MTAELAEAGERTEEKPPSLYGYVIIEWPAPKPGPHPRGMPAWGCSIFDAVTGKQITTVDKIAIPAVTADVTGWVTCELNMFADGDGMPVLFPEHTPGRPYSVKVCLDDDGKVRTGTFAFIVSEMRVRQP